MLTPEVFSVYNNNYEAEVSIITGALISGGPL